MKKTFLLGLILLNTLILTACSFTIDFIVVNKSNAPIEVEYTFKHSPENLDNINFQPYRINSADWDSWFGNKDEKWIKLSQTEYKLETESSRCRIKLDPKQALRILRTHDSMYFDENYENFEIVNIKLIGENGIVIFEGNQIFKQFEKKNYTNRFITYK